MNHGRIETGQGVMLPLFAMVIALSLPSLAPAANVAKVSPKELARAINMDDGRSAAKPGSRLMAKAGMSSTESNNTIRLS